MIPEVKKKMSAFPVSHENVLSWALSETENQISQLLKDRLEGTNRNVNPATRLSPCILQANYFCQTICVVIFVG